ncbi:MAG TPA: preprotein translocase subunit SecE [Acidimicrobiia bacterium]|nr:preprotein translocase subunit SecE [Acidimicrobiia bacterium]
MTQPTGGGEMNREMRRMSTKMGYDPESQRAQTKQAANKKRKPAPAGDRVSIFVKIITFFKEAWRELKKVSWPGRKEVINSTIIVLVCLIIVTLLVLVVDYGAERLADLIYG